MAPAAQSEGLSEADMGKKRMREYGRVSILRRRSLPL
jgi:hypothetical protein